MKISFAQADLSKVADQKSTPLVITVAADGALGPVGVELDGQTGGALTRAIAAAAFKGKADETLTILAPAGVAVPRVVLVGLGAPDKTTDLSFQSLGGAVAAALARAGAAEVSLIIDTHAGLAVDAVTAAAHTGYGALLRSYRFDKYKTKETKDQKPSLKKVVVQGADHADAKKLFGTLEKVADGVFLTRDVVSEPANIIYPETLADRCRELTELGVEVDVLDEKKMKKLGMGALLGVGQGSARPPRLVVMTWKGGKEGDAPLAFVGKGVTFDTGGISIKPAGGMEDMKWDMAGSGAVIGLMAALAGRKAKVNVVGVVGLVENMPDGNAQRPGDIVTSMSGQTIEVLNTDAEGRLVLADALWYTQETFKPRFMIDLATLTGAIIVSLGHEHAGLFANDDELAARIAEAGAKTGESVWRMPLGAAYDRDIDCDAADMKNMGTAGKAGSIIGAVFLQRFVNDVPWAHIDIAGTAWARKDSGTVPKGASGYGVRLLDRLVADYYEG